MSEINSLAAKNPYLSETELTKILKKKNIKVTPNLIKQFKLASEDYRTR